MISIDQLLQSLFQDVAKAGSEDSPGEMVRSSLAGQMPSAGPSGGSMSLPMSLGGPRMGGAPRVPGPPPVPGPRAPMVGAGPAPTQVAQAPYIPGNAMTDAAEGYRSGGLIGAIGNLMQGPETRAAMAQQYQRQQAEAQAVQNMTINALIEKNPGMSRDMAAVVARNSGLLKDFLQNPSGSDFDIIQAKDGTVLRVPKASGNASTVYKPDPAAMAADTLKPPSGYMVDPNNPGAVTFIPGGPADPANAKLTEEQTKSAVFGERIQRSNEVIDSLTKKDPVSGRPKVDPTAARNNWWFDDSYFNSNEWKQYRQAMREGLAAILRKESGAVISDQEFALYGPMYYPMPGDDARTIENKRISRKQAAEGLVRGSGPAFPRMYPGGGAGPSAPQQDKPDPLGIR